MMEDVVLVTFNYRISMIGFLSLCDPSVQVPGNAGLKDQVLALKWVKANIELFGGDSNNICVFGESAGGASVHYMLSTERTRNLFHKAICQSGSFLHEWALSQDAIELSYLLACRKGYKGPKGNDKVILKFLQSLPAEKLVEIDELDVVARHKGYVFASVPTIEPYESEDSIITKPLWEFIRAAWGNDIPLIIGGTSFEGLYMYPILKKYPDILERFLRKPGKLLPNDVPLEDNKKKSATLLEKLSTTLTKEHFGDMKVDRENILPILDYFSYRLLWHGLHRFLRVRLKYATKPTYQYVFDFDSPTFNHHRELFCGGDITKGVSHADDLSYLFYSFYSKKLDHNSIEFLTIQRMIKMWITFARTSNPNCEYVSDWEDIRKAGIYKWLNIGNELKFVDMPKIFQAQ
uniref:Carboxylic ester hydrolase n=1 Tax=Glossina brevipalpis TaxID=37001 RepID=A0A1A9W1E5_9MUSC